MIIALLACLVFSLFDYAGYNISKKSSKLLVGYRVLQYIVQAVITYVVWVNFSWKEAFAWLILWWTWLCDFMYYGWAWIINPKPAPNNAWEGREGLLKTLEVVTWAWWTPYGLIINGVKNKTRVIPLMTLIVQAILGFVLAFFITPLF